MKRILSVLIMLCMLIPLAACGKNDAATEPTSAAAATASSGSEPASESADEPGTESGSVPVTESVEESAAEPETVAEATPAAASETPVRDEELSGIFEKVMRVYPGTAGSSISAAACAVRLLDWGAETELNDDGIRSATEAWFEEQDEESRELFKESIRLVRALRDDLRDKDHEYIMDLTGIDSAFWPWNERAFSVPDTVCSACGVE